MTPHLQSREQNLESEFKESTAPDAVYGAFPGAMQSFSKSSFKQVDADAI